MTLFAYHTTFLYAVPLLFGALTECSLADEPARKGRVVVDLFRTVRGEKEITKALDVPAEMAASGPSASLVGLPLYIKSTWNIDVTVDESGLGAKGVALADLVAPDLHLSGLSRRSALRISLAAVGLGFFVRENDIVLTTEQTACVLWLARPQISDTKLLSSEDTTVRRATAYGLGFRKHDFDGMVDKLRSALQDSDLDVRCNAAFAIGQLGPAGAAALPDLKRMALRGDPTSRDCAVYAMGKIGPPAIPELLTLVQDDTEEIVVAGARGFRLMGAAANQSIHDVIEAALQSRLKLRVAHALGGAIGAISLGDGIGRLEELLSSDDETIRAFAAFAIGECGTNGQFAVERLLPLLEDPHLQVRREAAHALVRVRLPRETPADRLRSASKDPDRIVRLWAEEALRLIEGQQ